jgi:hypothetical protein
MQPAALHHGLYTIEVGSRSAHFCIMNYWWGFSPASNHRTAQLSSEHLATTQHFLSQNVGVIRFIFVFFLFNVFLQRRR